MFNYSCYYYSWRKPHENLKWTTQFRDQLVEEIKSIKPKTSITPCAILVGPSKAGKSSLVNTFLNSGSKDIVPIANSGTDDTSLTCKFKRYDGVEEFLNTFRLCDTMGILAKEDGIRPTDVLKVMQGHVRPGYKFDEETDIQEGSPWYVPEPIEEDKSHCFVIVLPADKVKYLSPGFVVNVKKAMCLARKEVSIPTVIILTQIDRICENVMYDNRKVFSCWHLKEIVTHTSEVFCIPEGNIFPVINYTDQVSKCEAPYIDIIALLALKKIVQCSSFLEGTETK